jgi:DNA-binding transcriptional MerR regulator
VRLSELAAASGTPIPTIKFYLRTRLLGAGRATSTRQADYDERHVERLRLIRVLVEVGGLPLAAVREVLDAMAGPGGVRAAIGVAHRALPPRPSAAGDVSRARAAVDLLGWAIDESNPALHQLDAALGAVESVGMAPGPRRLQAYGDAAMALARIDVAEVRDVGRGREAGADHEAEAIRYIVLGTILYEPLLLALRRLAQQQVFLSAEGSDGVERVDPVAGRPSHL